MHVRHKSTVKEPLTTPHGETVYELIGQATTPPNQRHSVAQITLPPGKGSRPHYHPHAEESFYILRGQARLIVGEAEQSLGPGQTVLIPRGVAHQISNPGPTELEFLAICVPAWTPDNSVWLD